jgi:hypothetical protein
LFELKSFVYILSSPLNMEREGAVEVSNFRDADFPPNTAVHPAISR